MFSDSYWVRWDDLRGDWSAVVRKMVSENKNLKVAVLEMGCGKKVFPFLSLSLFFFFVSEVI